MIPFAFLVSSFCISAVDFLLKTADLSFIRYLNKNFLKREDFKKFKKLCDKTGTTEESLANAEKLGFKTDLFVRHPFLAKKKLPVYFANFVLMDYGSGAIFGCPAHDQRD